VKNDFGVLAVLLAGIIGGVCAPVALAQKKAEAGPRAECADL
jgi:hypothetical protein